MKLYLFNIYLYTLNLNFMMHGPIFLIGILTAVVFVAAYLVEKNRKPKYSENVADIEPAPMPKAPIPKEEALTESLVDEKPKAKKKSSTVKPPAKKRGRPKR